MNQNNINISKIKDVQLDTSGVYPEIKVIFNPDVIVSGLDTTNPNFKFNNNHMDIALGTPTVVWSPETVTKIQQQIKDLLNKNQHHNLDLSDSNQIQTLQQDIQNILENNGLKQTDIQNITISPVANSNDVNIQVQLSDDTKLGLENTRDIVDDNLNHTLDIHSYITPADIDLVISDDQMNQLQKDLNEFINSHQSDLNNPNQYNDLIQGIQDILNKNGIDLQQLKEINLDTHNLHNPVVEIILNPEIKVSGAHADPNFYLHDNKMEVVLGTPTLTLTPENVAQIESEIKNVFDQNLHHNLDLTNPDQIKQIESDIHSILTKNGFKETDIQKIVINSNQDGNVTIQVELNPNTNVGLPTNAKINVNNITHTLDIHTVITPDVSVNLNDAAISQLKTAIDNIFNETKNPNITHETKQVVVTQIQDILATGGISTDKIQRIEIQQENDTNNIKIDVVLIPDSKVTANTHNQDFSINDNQIEIQTSFVSDPNLVRISDQQISNMLNKINDVFNGYSNSQLNVNDHEQINQKIIDILNEGGINKDKISRINYTIDSNDAVSITVDLIANSQVVDNNHNSSFVIENNQIQISANYVPNLNRPVQLGEDNINNIKDNVDSLFDKNTDPNLNLDNHQQVTEIENKVKDVLANNGISGGSITGVEIDQVNKKEVETIVSLNPKITIETPVDNSVKDISFELNKIIISSPIVPNVSEPVTLTDEQIQELKTKIGEVFNQNINEVLDLNNQTQVDSMIAKVLDSVGINENKIEKIQVVKQDNNDVQVTIDLKPNSHVANNTSDKDCTIQDNVIAINTKFVPASQQPASDVLNDNRAKIIVDAIHDWLNSRYENPASMVQAQLDQNYIEAAILNQVKDALNSTKFDSNLINDVLLHWNTNNLTQSNKVPLDVTITFDGNINFDMTSLDNLSNVRVEDGAKVMHTSFDYDLSMVFDKKRQEIIFDILKNNITDLIKNKADIGDTKVQDAILEQFNSIETNKN